MKYTLALTIALLLTVTIRASTQEPLTRVAEVRALTCSELEQALPVRLHGVVTWRERDFVIQDESAGIYVNMDVARSRKIWQGEDAVLENVKVGSVVEIEGVTDRGGFSPSISPRTIRIVGMAPLPTPQPMVPARFFSGVEDCQRITVQGVVQGSYQLGEHTIMLIMDGNPGVFVASVPSAGVTDAEALVDAEVRLTGIPMARFNPRGEFLMPHFVVSEATGLVVEKPAPGLPFQSPKVRVEDIAGFRSEPIQAHRRRVEGTVTAVFRGSTFTILYIQEGRTGLRVSVRGTATVSVGDRVEAVGFVDDSRPIRGLKGAVLRVCGTGSVPEPIRQNPEDILAANAAAASVGLMANPGDSDGLLIQFHARLVKKLEPEPGLTRLVLETPSSSLVAILEDSDPAALSQLLDDSQLAVTGIVRLLYSPEVDSHGEPMGMELLLRSRDDIVVLMAPSWWTRTRVIYALAGIALALAGASVWVLQLRGQVKAQTKRLADAMRTHRDLQLEMKGAHEERCRLAADLHDGLQQHLTGASYRMEAALMRLPDESANVREHLTSARAALERTRTGLRECLLGLRHVEEGPTEFPALLRHAAEKMEHWPRGAVEITTVGEPFPLSRQVMGSLLLLMQEAVGNAFHHGSPTRVTVTLEYLPERLELRIEDDGSGFDLAEVPDPALGHFGLESMKHRLRWLGGKTTITSLPSEGTRVIAVVPRSRVESETPDAEDEPPP